MRRILRVTALVLGVVAWLLLSHTLQAGPCADSAGPAVEAAAVCLGSTWTPRVTITRNALEELRERMARYDYKTGICLTGPFEEDFRAPESIEEAWLIEKLYGRPPRWVLDIVPLRDLGTPSLDPGEMFYVDNISGITVGIHTSKTVAHLSVELRGDAIRVYELDI